MQVSLELFVIPCFLFVIEFPVRWVCLVGCCEQLRT